MQRGVWQLETLTLKYCRHGGSSRGMREFIEHKLEAFSKANPQLRVEVEHIPSRHPNVTGTYVHGRTKQLCAKNEDKHDIWNKCWQLRNETGRKAVSFQKGWVSKTPSITGEWDIMTDYAKQSSQ